MLTLISACASPDEGRRAALEQKKPIAKKGDKPVPNYPVESVVVIDAMEFPFSAIGRVNVSGEGYCTGIMIASDVVLAPASCLYNWKVGKWRGAVELFFQAGYQREKARENTKVVNFATPPQFKPGKYFNLANAQYDMALIRLAEPIGNRVGWLGLKWFDGTLEDARLDRVTLIYHAGYAKGRPFIQSLETGCNRVTRDCGSPENLLNLRAIGETAGKFHAIAASKYLNSPEVQNRYETIFNDMWQKIGKQRLGGFEQLPVPPHPRKTVIILLEHLGYIPAQVAKADDDQVRDAIKLFQRHQGVQDDGNVDLRLLSRLLREVSRRGTPVS